VDCGSAAVDPIVRDPSPNAESGTVANNATTASETVINSRDRVSSAGGQLELGDGKLVVENSLWMDLERTLYGVRFDRKEELSPLYQSMHVEANRFLVCIILSLQRHEDVFAGRPLSHVFVDLISCVHFFRAIVAVEDPITEAAELQQFLDKRKEFWSNILTDTSQCMFFLYPLVCYAF